MSCLLQPFSLHNRIKVKYDEKSNQFAIVAKSLNFGSIFARLGRELAKIVKEGNNKLLSEIISSVIYGRSLFYTMRDLLIILANEQVD